MRAGKLGRWVGRIAALAVLAGVVLAAGDSASTNSEWEWTAGTPGIVSGLR